MQRLTTLCSTVALALSLSACSTVAPQYSSSLDNIAVLKKDAGGPVKVGAFQTESDKLNSISLRGTGMASPYEQSYAKYLGEALKQELIMAGKYAPDADIELSGTLLKNDIDASGFSAATGNIDARVVVKNRSVVKYDKVKSIKQDWESSFVGSVAIPRAVAAYPGMVSKLLGELYADPEFIAALKQ